MHPPLNDTEPALDWAYLERLQARISAPIVLKGILHPEDARRAVDAGAAAIVVSNHGGRTLDGAIPTAEILPEVADAVGGQVELLVDGGIRRGSDVLRALALGARAVLVGRPFLWGLAIAGEAGQRRVFSLFRDELEEDARFCGIADLTAVPRDLVRLSRLGLPE
jgi:4-hydroxymandelate oxidase